MSRKFDGRDESFFMLDLRPFCVDVAIVYAVLDYEKNVLNLCLIHDAKAKLMKICFRTPFDSRGNLLFVCVLIFLILTRGSCAVLAKENEERNSIKTWNVVFYAPWSVGEHLQEVKKNVDEFKRILEKQPNANLLFFSPFESEERRATSDNLETLLKLFAFPDDDILSANGTRLPKLRNSKTQKIDLRFFICATTENGALIFPNEETTKDVDDNFWKQACGVVDFVAIFSCLRDVGSNRAPDFNRPLEAKYLKAPKTSELSGRTFGFAANNSIRDDAYFAALIDVFNGKADGNDGSRRNGETSSFEALQYVASYRGHSFQDEENVVLHGESYYLADSIYGEEKPADPKLLLELAAQLNSLKLKGNNINEALLKETKTRAWQITLDETPAERFQSLQTYDSQFHNRKFEWKGKLEVLDITLRGGYEYLYLKNGDGASFWIRLVDFEKITKERRGR